MISPIHQKFPVFALALCLAFLPACAGAEANLSPIKAEYQSTDAKLKKHLVEERWIDDNPELPKLLAREWQLAGEWVAAWLNAHPSHAGVNGVRAALTELTPTETPEYAPEYLQLSESAFLVGIHQPLGNVFIVAKSGGQYRLAWSIAKPQKAQGGMAGILEAWQAKNAIEGGRGPYWVASGCAGSVSPQLGALPSDAKGHARFYIEGSYAQSAGVTVGMQTSLWVWDGTTAIPQLAKNYAIGLSQKVGTRLEGDLFKVQQKDSFRTFFTTGGTDERQVEWIVRITPDGMKELGEKPVVPELDAADELFYRLIKGKPAADIASPAAIEAAEKVIGDARMGYSDKEWKKYPMVGELSTWSLIEQKDEKILCLDLDPGIDSGAYLFTLAGNNYFIASIIGPQQSCPQ